MARCSSHRIPDSKHSETSQEFCSRQLRAVSSHHGCRVCCSVFGVDHFFNDYLQLGV